MVVFRDILSAVTENSLATFLVARLNTKHQPDVELHRISAPEPTPAPSLAVALSSASAASASVVTRQKRVAQASAPAPTLVVSDIPTPPRVSDVSRYSEQEEDSDDYIAPPTRTISVVQIAALAPSPASLSPPSHSASPDTAKLPTKTTAATSTPVVKMREPRGPVLDPIAIGVHIRDPMYDIATAAVKQSIECEEARALESMLDELYKSESGRSRGWTKTHLTEFLVPRAAAGSKVSAKQAFQWSKLLIDKHTAAALDFVCLAKGIRLAVWFSDTQEIRIWPAADSSKGNGVTPLFHISDGGQSMGDMHSVVVSGWTVCAAPSVEHSLEKLSLGELENLAEQIGIGGTLTGKKTDRVHAIASHRTKQRLGL